MPYLINLAAAWGSFLFGVISGALIGLNFHKDNWIGGYHSFPRRLLRLGHIAFFGLGFLNVMFVMSTHSLASSIWLDIASEALLVAMATMSLVCFLCAWRKVFRHLFFIPVSATLTGIVCTLTGAYLS